MSYHAITAESKMINSKLEALQKAAKKLVEEVNRTLLDYGHLLPNSDRLEQLEEEVRWVID